MTTVTHPAICSTPNFPGPATPTVPQPDPNPDNPPKPSPPDLPTPRDPNPYPDYVDVPPVKPTFGAH